jgi:septal ring factor EnvC (AmiA/AmiB activator)
MYALTTKTSLRASVRVRCSEKHTSSTQDIFKQLVEKRKTVDKERYETLSKLHEQLKTLANEEMELAKSVVKIPSSKPSCQKQCEKKEAVSSVEDAIVNDITSETSFVEKSSSF